MSSYYQFHKGELEVQQITGEQHIAAMTSSMVQNVVQVCALHFIRQKSVIWIGIEDNDGFLWAFPLFGLLGFIDPNNGVIIDIDLTDKSLVPDGWFKMLEKGKAIGCLVIEFSTLRRIRINGIIKEINKNLLRIDVQQAYPNCTRYIRRRKTPRALGLCKLQFESAGTELNKKLIDVISKSDTAFVASVGPNGADVSHRGGTTGFIECDSRKKLIVPDYKGNSMFNTLGNFKANPRAGLIIIEFHRGHFLQLTGKTNIVFNNECPRIATGGTNRYWELVINKWQLFKLFPNSK